MIICYIGKFERMNDEEYIARGFENIGHKVIRIPDHMQSHDIIAALNKYEFDILLYCKWNRPPEARETIERLQRKGVRTVCWLFDLYFSYTREYQVAHKHFFKSDYVFTTDGGHQKEFEALGINHICVRQGIRTEECFIQKGKPKGIIFVGSDNPAYPYRLEMINAVKKKFQDFTWHGRGDPDEVRGVALNELYGNTRIVLGDSVFSPYYWSNRVVETLGRGGFLIHPDVPGIKEEYPHLVTYTHGNFTELTNKIHWYWEHDKEREELIERNWQWVRDHYTIEKKCVELLSYIK